jgi:hypothetical protein
MLTYREEKTAGIPLKYSGSRYFIEKKIENRRFKKLILGTAEKTKKA